MRGLPGRDRIMRRTTTIELFKESFKFSSGHFTIFSATERENLHGHNFTVHVSIDTVIDGDGLAFDYRAAKALIEELCRSFNEYMLIPARSRHVTVTEENGLVIVGFADERIPFLPRDIKLLPVENVTVEDLSALFLEQFRDRFAARPGSQVSRVTVKVFSGPGQSGSATWQAAAPVALAASDAA